MMMLKSFTQGGIHPAENKLSATKPLLVAPLPEMVWIPVSQQLGKAPNVLVAKGDKVKVGQLIAESAGFISANLHASVSGAVTKISDEVDASGYKRPVIEIKVEGDEWDEKIDRSSELKREIVLAKDEIINRIQAAGIVGLGGATFPTHVKLRVPDGRKIDTLLINGVECEPYLTADHRLMLEKSEEILVGIQILMKAMQVARAVIGIENNKPDAIEKLASLVKDYAGIEVQPLAVKYPQGGEKQLIKAVLNREVPSGKLPLDVGVVVQNVGTAFAVYEAVQKNKPLIERVVTITGKPIANPGNFWVRNGTRLVDILPLVGGMPNSIGKIIFGGPMMGKAVTSVDVPVVKGTSGILFMAEEESLRGVTQICVRCAKCVKACPMCLEPYLLSALARKSMWQEAEAEKIMDCIECGSCSFECPSAVPILDYIRLGKTKVGQIIRARKNN